MDPAWTVRRASLRDADGIADLCRRAVGADDYVLEYLPWAILRGVVNLVEDADRVVGMMHYRDLIDGAGWLAMARTDPGTRRRGVARALIESFVGLARNKRRTALRLWTEATNAAGMSAARSSGWMERGRFTRMRAAAGGTAAIRVLPFSERAYTQIETSSFVKAGGGYVPYGWGFIRADRPSIFQMCSRRSVVRTTGGTYIRSVDPEETDREALDVGLLIGSPARAVRGARALAKASGFRKVEAFMPLKNPIVRAAKAAGWEPETWGREAVLFEKPLDVTSVIPRRRRTYAEIASSRTTGYAARSRLAAGDRGHAGHSD